MILLQFLFFIISHIFANPDNGCPEKCGSVEIPFPFGIGKDCFLHHGFEISCNQSPNPTPYLYGTPYKVLSISNGELRIDSTPYIAIECHDGSHNATRISLPQDGPFIISPTSNTFTAIGCDTVAVITDDKSFTSGCVSLCSSQESVVDGSCSGVGCCESAIPKGKKKLGMGTSTMFNFKKVLRFDNCSYAFIVEKGNFSFAEHYLRDFVRTTSIAMSLDWSIGSLSCSRIDSVVCGENSVCVDSVKGDGYLCRCADGYAGNPYLHGSKGCQDIDECLGFDHGPCVDVARCFNRNPGYKCVCPFGSSGDGTLGGSGCRKISLVAEAILGTGLGFGVVLLCGLLFYSALKKRTLMKLKEQYFRQNGGLILKQQVSTHEVGTGSARIFSSKELKLATENYSSDRILGTGGYGTVYKGTLEDGSIVAIKRSKVIDQSQINQFINEFIILTQINHRNVVKLLGCCLETEVPMLIYEFISNGTLYGHIHYRISENPFFWADRLRIAVETAEALSYLHSAASMPIFHRDVKSSNILLDEHYTAKVADFGISRLVPLDQTKVPTLVQGTLGYLDPEYFQTSQLTEKSDVYSFGVVLVELLTGQKPVTMERSQEDSNLAMYFLVSMKTKDLSEFLDKNVFCNESIDELQAVCELAKRCLRLRGETRPTMKEVAQELAVIAGFRKLTEVKVDEDYQLFNLFEPQDSFWERFPISCTMGR